MLKRNGALPGYCYITRRMKELQLRTDQETVTENLANLYEFMSPEPDRLQPVC